MLNSIGIRMVGDHICSFLIYLMFSKYGNIRLGRNDSKPKYSFFSWISMLFAAGMGIGLMYFSVAEPMQHYSNDVFTGNNHINRAKMHSCIPSSIGDSCVGYLWSCRSGFVIFCLPVQITSFSAKLLLSITER